MIAYLINYVKYDNPVVKCAFCGERIKSREDGSHYPHYVSGDYGNYRRLCFGRCK